MPISTFCSLASFGSSNATAAVTMTSTAAITKPRRRLRVRCSRNDLRTQLVDLRQHARVDFLELAHRARGHFRFVRHDGRREIVGGGVEQGDFTLRGDVGGGAFEPERVLQHRVHFVGHVAHGRRTLAALLG